MGVLSKSIKVALVQLAATSDKAYNLSRAKEWITKAAANGAELIVLPECFNSPYSVTAFPKYAELIPQGDTTVFLSNLSKDLGVLLVGGSIPEVELIGNVPKYYNTSLSFGPDGVIIAKHRKVHLFDIDIPGKISFKESTILSPGEKATVFNLPTYGNVGLGICYDIRFPELAAISARSPNNAFAQIYPGAFNTTTGPLHWHLLARARAVDNQIYVIVASPARDLSSDYHAYGHSLVVDPYGKIVSEAGEGEEIVYATLDPQILETIKSGIPISTQRRFDVYRNIANDAKVSSI